MEEQNYKQQDRERILSFISSQGGKCLGGGGHGAEWCGALAGLSAVV